MLGSDKSRGYCLEMIYADFQAGANLESEITQVLYLQDSCLDCLTWQKAIAATAPNPR